MCCTQVILRESSSDESSDRETRNAAASTTVSNDKRLRVMAANSCKNGQAFDGNLAVSVAVKIMIGC